MNASPSAKGRLVFAFAGLLLLDFVLVLVMLATDKNLQTDFGATSAYYLHWYAGLALGILTLIAALFVLLTAGRSTSDGKPTNVGRWAVMGGTVWAWLAVIGLVAVVATFKQVGFSSANQFAHYLFGFSAYPGALSYVPWLYDLVFALYAVSAIIGSLALYQVQTATRSAAAM
jgi:hypothetical protein